MPGSLAIQTVTHSRTAPLPVLWHNLRMRETDQTRARIDDDAVQHDNAEGAAGDTPDGTAQAAEIGGRAGPDPTRYGDWEKNGRCIDF